MAALTKNPVASAGLRIDNLFVSAAGGGDTAPTGTGVFLIVKNGSGSSITVTLGYPNYDGQAVTGKAFTVAATTGESVIPLRDIYRDPSTGVAAITYSAVTTVTVCVVSVP